MKGNRRDRLMWTESQFVSCSAAWKTNTQHIVRSVCEHTQRRAQTHPVIITAEYRHVFQQIQNQTESLVTKGQMSSYWFLFLVNWQLLACSQREKTRLQIHLVSEQWVTHNHTLLCVFVPRCVGSASPRSVCFSPASAGSVWPAAHTPAGRCSDSDGPTAAACNAHAHTHTHNIDWKSVRRTYPPG